MGCDIHFYVEKKVNGVWESADTWEIDDCYEDEQVYNVPYKKSFYNGRNYDLFAMLADVRNGYGFAGVVTGEGFFPIDEPRGLPENTSERVKQASERSGIDGHSHSHFYVSELLRYDWTRRTKHKGVVSLAQYYDWLRWRKEEGRAPESYSGDIHGQGIIKIPMATADNMLEKLRQEIDAYDKFERERALEQFLEKMDKNSQQDRYYVNIEWEEPYYRSASEFLAETMPRLWRLGQPEDVRIVFFFDN